MIIYVYVAGASKNKERARAFMDLVRAHPGMRLTKDWVADIDAADAAGKTDADFDNKTRAKFANADLGGLAGSDVAVFLVDLGTTGMWVELGYAICLREGEGCAPRIIVSGGDRRSIFTVPAPMLVDHEVAGDGFSADIQSFRILRAYAQ